MSQQNPNNVERNVLSSGSPQTPGLTPPLRPQGAFGSPPRGEGVRSTGSGQSSGDQAQNSRRSDNKQEVVSITYEEIGLFPRSFSRVLDRFLKQVFSDVENLVIQEYRFYRYLFLTTFKSLLILFLVPFFVNFLAKNYVVRPLTEYFWNTKQTEIFLNSYQQKRAFAELKDFEEKLYFESLIYLNKFSLPYGATEALSPSAKAPPLYFALGEGSVEFSPEKGSGNSGESNETKAVRNESSHSEIPFTDATVNSAQVKVYLHKLLLSIKNKSSEVNKFYFVSPQERESDFSYASPLALPGRTRLLFTSGANFINFPTQSNVLSPNNQNSDRLFVSSNELPSNNLIKVNEVSRGGSKIYNFPTGGGGDDSSPKGQPVSNSLYKVNDVTSPKSQGADNVMSVSDEKTESLINSYTLKSSLFVYQTREAEKTIKQRYQEKTIELAQRYNDQSIEAITNFFADFISFLTLFYLLYALEIQINITKSFLLEVFFGLDDSKKSLLILLVTDLLVGYHSSHLWELFFEFLFHHYGLPESQTGIFLLVATLPVLLDVLFKYLIFRHLNRSSPATVATYHAMIE